MFQGVLEVPEILVSSRSNTRSNTSGPKKRFACLGGGLYRHRSGSYYAVFRSGGRLVWKRLKAVERGAARTEMAEALNGAVASLPTSNRRLTLSELVELHRQNPLGLAPSTLKIRQYLLKRFVEGWPNANAEVASVSTLQVMLWLSQQRKENGVSVQAVNNYIRALRGLFKLAVDAGAVASSPLATIKVTRGEDPERRTPDWETAKRLVAAVVRPRSRELLEFMLYAGLGQAEVGNLMGEDFDFVRQEISIKRQKTGRRFRIPMYPALKPILERLREEKRTQPELPVFKLRNAGDALQAACIRLGLPHYSPRALRRCFIVHCLEKGVDPRLVAQWQGHQDNGALILKVYGRFINGDHAKQMAAMVV